MHIERLEIFGFKSFARKTELVFGPELCVVMGPNGCGKSNILDAIRWAVGEQRMSLLRSTTLEDVIFKGSAGMKPLNFAEVSVQLANAQGLLSYDPKADRIKITRRTYRDGESKFFINGASVRLKDIRSILATVGLGDVGYAVIEQVMIDRILGGGAEERRILFEQAAGIAKYKTDKAATEHKLKATQEDLIRLDDILREISEQEAILKRQVRRARQYKNLQEKARQTEMALILGRLGRYNIQKEKISSEIAGLRAEEQKVSAQLADIVAKIQKIFAKRTEKERIRDEIAERRRKIERKIADAERDSAVLKEKIDNARNLILSADDTEKKLKMKIEKARGEIKRLEDAIVEFENRKNKIARQRENLLKKKSEVDKSLLKLKREISQIEGEEKKLREKLFELNNHIGFGKSERDNIVEQIKSLDERIATDRDELKNQIEIVQTSQDLLAKLEDKRKKLLGEINGIRKERTEVAEKLKGVNADVSLLSQRRSELMGRISQIESIISSGRDIGDGAKRLLSRRDKRIIGVLADLIDVDDENSAAVEQILGERVKFLVVETADDVLAAVENAPQNSGEIGFIILSELPEPTNIPDWFSASDRRLFSLISDAKILKNADLKDFKNSPTDEKVLVSTNGKVIRRRGELRIVLGKRRTGALAMRRQIAKMRSELADVDGKLNVLTEDKKTFSKKYSHLDENLSELDEELRNTEKKYSDAEREYQWAKARIEQLKKNIAQLEEQREEREISLKKLDENLNRWRSDAEKIGKSHDELLEKMEKLDDERKELERHSHELDEKISSNELANISNEGEIRHAGQDIEREKIAKQDAENEIAKLKKNIADAKKSIVEFEVKIAKRGEEIQKLFSTRDELEQEEEKVRREIEKIQEEADKMRKSERAVSQQRDELRLQLAELDKKLSAINASAEQMKNRALDEADAIPDSPQPISEEEERELVRKLENYKRRLQQEGSVNLEAEEQYAAVRQRLDFFNEQKKDILQSIGDLKQTISRLDQEAKRLFQETFEAARKNFKSVFTELFEDGEADILLEKPDEPLESDIIIKIKPAGKRQLSLSQLSAGEKALTALALLFGLYLVKPSPFCLMDEVDAPLDDSNVMRFLKLIRKFSDKIQFIVVSHNKRTLECADYLYGVSMERDGISKIVSIKMSDLKLQLE